MGFYWFRSDAFKINWTKRLNDMSWEGKCPISVKNCTFMEKMSVFCKKSIKSPFFLKKKSVLLLFYLKMSNYQFFMNFKNFHKNLILFKVDPP